MPKGGARPGAGRPKKSPEEKALEGKNDLKVLRFPVAEEDDVSVPVPDFLKAEQIGGGVLDGESILLQLREWLRVRGCLNLINPQLLIDYAMCRARYIQCENRISKRGMMAKHPTTGGQMMTQLQKASLEYLRAADAKWSIVQRIIDENCTSAFDPRTAGDPIEAVLSQEVKRGG